MSATRDLFTGWTLALICRQPISPSAAAVRTALGEKKTGVRVITDAGRSVWRAVVPRSVRMAFHRAVKRSPEYHVHRLLRKTVTPTPGPLVVSGLLSESKGVSQAARLTIAGLKAAGFDPIAHDLRATLSQLPDGSGVLPFETSGGAWLLHANPPEAVHALLAIDPAAWRGRYRIGYWSWELPVAPARWASLAPAFHEIWTPTRFVADSLCAARIRTPIKIIPHPVALDPPCAGRNRVALGLPEKPVVVIAMGDLNSSADRKNLLGAVDIYRCAFPQADGQTLLLVKTQAEETHPGFRTAVAAAAGDRNDIRFITGALPQAEVHTLIASSDILLSPHRSEGFGLSLAEAFLLGVPALATGWSGNLDFMGSLPELLIDHMLVSVADSFGVYANQDQVWAEPSLDDAVAKLRALATSADQRARLAEAGRKAVLALSEPWRSGGEVAAVFAPYASHSNITAEAG